MPPAMDDRRVRRGSWVYPIKEDLDHKGAGCSGPAVQAGSGLTVPGLAEVADLISDSLPFGRLWYGGENAVSNAIGYVQHYSRSHDAVTRVDR